MGRPSRNLTRVCAFLPNNALERLDSLALKRDLSRSDVLREVLETGLPMVELRERRKEARAAVRQAPLHDTNKQATQ